MVHLFASGDSLAVDSEARLDPGKIRPGDIVAYLDWAGAPSVSVHRVIFRFRTKDGGWKFLTKGDGNLWFDPLVDAAQITGKVTGLFRGGRPVAIDSGPCYWAGIFIACYSLFAAAATRVCGEAARAVVYFACRAEAAAMVLARRLPPARALVPVLLRCGIAADPNRYECFSPAFSWLPGKVMDLASALSRRKGAVVPGAEKPAGGCAGTVLAGIVKGSLTLGGPVTICGDVTIMPGAALVLLPGSTVRFSSVKSADSCALRAAGGGLREFRNDKLCKILVYGEFTCAGSPGAPVTMGGSGADWDCVAFLGRSRGVLENVLVSGAISPFWAMDFSRVRLSGIKADARVSRELCVAAGCSTVELNGTVAEGTASPVSVLDLAKMTVRDCGFSGADTAVNVSGAARCRVSNTAITGCRRGIYAAGARVLGVNVAIRACLEQGLLLEDSAVFHGRGGEITGSGAQAARLRSGAKLLLSGTAVTDGHEGILSEGSGTALKGVKFRGNREFSVCHNGGKHSLSGCLVCGGEIGVGVYKNARCSINGLLVSGVNGAGLDIASARVNLAKAEFKACGTGLKAGGDSSVVLNSISVAGCGTGIAAAGGARVFLSGSAVRDCAKGAWLQGGANAAVSGCVFENSSFAGIYADNGVCTARETVLIRNNIGVFSDNGAVTTLYRTEFSGNRTGVKADHRARVDMKRCVVRGCEWDGIWCAGEAGLKLEFNEFAANGCGIKEDGPCAVKAVENKFISNKADRFSRLNSQAGSAVS